MHWHARGRHRSQRQPDPRRGRHGLRRLHLSRARVRHQAAGEDLADDQPEDRTGPAAAVTEVDALDLAREHIGTIIWATGYACDLGWVTAPVLDNAGRPVQRRGVTQQPGLYFLGLRWMHTIKSGLLSGVGNDAEYLADHIAGTH